MRKVALVLSLACALSLCAQPIPRSPEWKPLSDGNGAFQGKAITFDDLINTRGRLVPPPPTNGQNPPVTVLSCSDSRVPPELVFKQTLGRLFVVRSAGNVTDSLGIASMEYAIAKGWTKMIVVLAHEQCGAVEEAMKSGEHSSPNLTDLLRVIRASFSGPCPPGRDCWVFRTQQNAEYTITDLKRRSEVIRKAIDVNKLPVVIAYYELKSGKVIVWKTINN